MYTEGDRHVLCIAAYRSDVCDHTALVSEAYTSVRLIISSHFRSCNNVFSHFRPCRLLDCNFTRDALTADCAVMLACFSVGHRYMDSPTHGALPSVYNLTSVRLCLLLHSASRRLVCVAMFPDGSEPRRDHEETHHALLYLICEEIQQSGQYCVASKPYFISYARPVFTPHFRPYM